MSLRDDSLSPLSSSRNCLLSCTVVKILGLASSVSNSVGFLVGVLSVLFDDGDNGEGDRRRFRGINGGMFSWLWRVDELWRWGDCLQEEARP